MDLLTAICLLALSPTTMTDRGISGEPRNEMTTVFTFDTGSDSRPWPATNDGVMGGISQGQSEISPDGTLRFSGNVSLENNGGFSSIRSPEKERDLSAYRGISIRVRGDGKRYALTLRTDVRIRAGSYRVKFDTKTNEWLEIFFPFADFRATSFGVELTDVPPLDPRRIRSFGFMISDKQVGPFHLEVDWIKAARRQAS